MSAAPVYPVGPGLATPAGDVPPPHDVEAEAAVLKQLLLDPEPEMFEAVELKPSHFYSEAHARTFEALAALYADGRPVGLEAVEAELRRTGRLKQVGYSYLRGNILGASGVPSQLAKYAARVRELAELRRVLLETQRLEAQLRLGRLDVAQAREALGQIRDGVRVANDGGGLRVWTPAEIWEPLPPPDYAIGGLLMRGNLALIVAYGSSLKTWAMVDLLVAKASGGDWLGMFPCEAGPVLFVDWENGSWEARRRLQGVAKARGLEGPVEGVHMISMPPLFFTEPSFEGTIRELAAKYSLICFDSLASGSVGVDENSAAFAAGLSTLKRIGPDLGCTFVVLHHTKKQGADAGKYDERELGRGTSAIYNNADVQLNLTRRDDGAYLVRQTKARSGKSVAPFVVRVDDLPDGGISVRAEPHVPDDGAAAELHSDVLNAAKRKVAALLSRERGLTSKSAIYRHVKGTKSVALDAIDDLLEAGVVVVHEGAFRLASEVDR